jgi:hypothetical protein
VRLREKVNFPKALALVNKGADYRSGGSELIPFGGNSPYYFFDGSKRGQNPGDAVKSSKLLSSLCLRLSRQSTFFLGKS